jgi:predicted transcriptional regulator
MSQRWVLAVAACAVLALAFPAQAEPGTITGRALLPLEIPGTHAATGSDARILLEGQDGQASLLVQGVEGKATRVIHRAWGFVNTQDPKLGVQWDDDVQHIDLPLADSLLSLDARRPDFRLLAYDGALTLGSGANNAPLLVGVLDQAKSVDYQLDQLLTVHLNPPKPGDQFHQEIPAGVFTSRSDDGRVTADGAFQLFVNDAVLDYRGADGKLQQIPAYFRIEKAKGQVYNPATHTWIGDGDHEEYVQEYLLLETTAGHMDLQFAGTPASLYASQPSVTVDGLAHLKGMEGTVTVTRDGKSNVHTLQGQDLDLGGRFTLLMHDPLHSPARTQVEGDGDITTVTYGSVSAHYPWAQAAAAAGLGALVLAGLAWAALNAKTALGSIGAAIAGYARVNGQEVLEHPGRQEVYERVKAFAGVSFIQLAEQVAFGASTLTYHLRVLEREGYISSVRDGRYLRFFDRQAGTYAGERKHAVSALRNTTSAAMARHIRDNPGVAQCELADKFEVTPSTVTWHINRLTTAGLVTRQRDAHYTRYYIAEGWSRLPLEEQARMAQTVQVGPLATA